jgi:hypothetical protein
MEQSRRPGIAACRDPQRIGAAAERIGDITTPWRFRRQGCFTEDYRRLLGEGPKDRSQLVMASAVTASTPGRALSSRTVGAPDISARQSPH